MNIALNISLTLALFSVVAVLLIGIIGMIKGGEFNEKYGNRLMRARVILQGVAVALLALTFFVSKQ